MMTFRRWDPFQDLLSMHQALFGEGPEPGLAEPNSSWSPPVDIFETAAAYVLKAEVPGLDPDQIKVVFKDRRLIVSGDRPAQRIQNARHHQAERLYGPFERRFILPECVSCNLIEANYENGVLEILVPKTPDRGKKTITIKSEGTPSE